MSSYGAAFAEVYNRRWAGFARGMAPRVQAFYESLPQASRHRSVLDLCCGTGQLAVHFLDEGYRVVGLDRSEDMLAWARRNSGRHVESGRARFVRGDVRDFHLEERFGLATCLFDSLNHLDGLDDLERCFQCVRGALDPGGVFIFDLNTRLGFQQRWNNVEVVEAEDHVLVVRGIYDGSSDRALMRISGFVRRGAGWERFSELFAEHAFASTEVLRALQRAGFRRAWPAVASDLGAPVSEPEAVDRVFFVAFPDASPA